MKNHDEIGNEVMANLALDDALDAFQNAISLYISGETPERKRDALNIIVPLRAALEKLARFGSQPNQRFIDLKRIAPDQDTAPLP